MPKGVDKQTFRKFKKYYEPDIFRESGRRIREMAKAADKLTIEDRISRIATIFNTFRNPDKETVLTPWRVVNMHLGDCIGGYCFYNKEYDQQLEEPRYIDHGEVTQKIFSTDSHVLEINSKSGLYPLYVAYSIYRNRLKSMKEKYGEIDHGLALKLWDATIENNIFVLCKTPMAKSITRRTLAGFRNTKVNAIYFKDLIKDITNQPALVVNTIKDGKHFWKINDNENMKFDAIVGNPPYQITQENTSDDPIYYHFYDLSFKLSSFVTLITPARFLFNVGKTPKEWNKKVLNDNHFKVIRYNQDSSYFFPNTEIKGGIAITIRDESKNFGKIGAFSIYPQLNTILNKIENTKDFKSIMNEIYLQNKFNLAVLYKDFPKYKNIIGSKGNEKRLTTKIFDQISIFTKEKSSTDDIKIIGLIDNSRYYRYIPIKYLDTHENLSKYKVILPKSNGTGALGEKLSAPFIGEPKLGYTQSFIGIGAFNNKTEAEAALKYIKTKFTRTMLGILKVTQDNNKPVWKFVPLQDFTSASDINWNGSISDIDRQLYHKYNLTNEEITFIEDHIKPMD